MIRADYHFHPNFPFFNKKLTEKRAHAIWKSFDTNNLDVVLVTEHSYKQAQHSFETLSRTKGEHRTFIVPGAECISKEGIDLIVFSRTPEEIYTQKTLLTPYGLSITEMVDCILKHNLYGIIVHPHTPGGTSIVRVAGKEIALDSLKKLGFLEKHNGALSVLQKAFEDTRLNRIFVTKYGQMVETHTAPMYLTSHARVLTVGSDAHFPEDLGNASEINEEYHADYNYLFEMITQKTGRFYERSRKSLLTLIPNGITTFLEFAIKTSGLYRR